MDIDIIRKDFPLTRRIIYMNNASTSPMPLSSIKAATDFMMLLSEYGPDSRFSSERINELIIDTRRKLARILNASEEEIIFTHSTTEGINIVSRGLKLKKGDNIIIRDGNHEHMSNYIPWVKLEELGVEVRRLSIGEHGSINLDELESKIDDNTRLIALTHILYNTGLILPVEEVSKIARKYSIPFFIDAAQSVGSIEVDLKKIGCDFLSFPASKWLCGPTGIGVFYCKKERQDMLEPLVYGPGSAFIRDERVILNTIPTRFEGGFRNYIGIAAFNASLKYIMNVGINNIRKRNIQLANMIRDELKDRLTIYGPEDEKMRNSIVSFSVNDINNLIEKLESNNIVVAKREIAGKNIVRVSPHFFNDEREVNYLTRTIKELL